MGRTWVVLFGLLAACQTVFGIRQVGSDGSVVDVAPRDVTAALDGPTNSNIVFDKAWSSETALPGTTATVVFGTPPMEHDLIVVAIASWHNAPQLVTDAGSNAYSMVPASTASQGGSHVYMYYAYNVHTASPFAVTVATVPSSDGDNEVTAIAHDYSGALWTDSRDGQNTASGTGSGAVVSATCGDVMASDYELILSAITRDFNGTANVAGMWKLEASVDMPHAQYMVLATADQIFGPGTIASSFMLDHNADGYTWACLTAMFR